MDIDKFPKIFTEGFYAKLKYNTSYPNLFNWFSDLSKAKNPNFKVLINKNDVYVQNKELKEYNCHKICTSDFDEIAQSIKETINGIFKYSMDFTKECNKNETFDKDILISVEKIIRINSNHEIVFDHSPCDTSRSNQQTISFTMKVTNNISISADVSKKIYRDLNSEKAIQFIEKMAIDNNLTEVARLRSQKHEEIFFSGYKIYDLCQLNKYKKSGNNIDKFCCTANNMSLSGKYSRHGKSTSNAKEDKKITDNEAEKITNEMIDIYLNEKTQNNLSVNDKNETRIK